MAVEEVSSDVAVEVGLSQAVVRMEVECVASWLVVVQAIEPQVESSEEAVV